jgi:hypothetical protein
MITISLNLFVISILLFSISYIEREAKEFSDWLSSAAVLCSILAVVVIYYA